LKLLLDTHVLLWWLDDDPRLRRAARDSIARAETALVSIASLWEVSIKHRVGKLRASAQDVAAQLPRDDFQLIPVSVAHLGMVETFRDAVHGDPFDHLIAAQAIIENAQLVTADRVMQAYGVSVIVP
jgi:PIN domain nuclease of toxin-antitoxin system